MNWRLSFQEAERYSDPNRLLYPETCPHDKRVYRVYKNAGGRDEVRHQCLRCGERGKPISKARQQTLGLIVAELAPCEPDDNERRSESYRQNEETRRQKWFAVYRQYLQSPAWLSVRQRVLARDQKQCQGCLQEEAVEAHHLTFAHIGGEFLFELVAIGVRCQAKLRLPEDKIPR